MRGKSGLAANLGAGVGHDALCPYGLNEGKFLITNMFV